MRRFRTFLIALTAVMAGASSASAASVPFTGKLSGAQEVPPVSTSASGTASGMLSGGAGNYVFDYEVSYSGLSTPIAPVAGTGGHLHNAPAGSNGPVVHLLDTSPFNYTGTQSGTIAGDWRYDDATNPLTDSLAQQLLAGAVYINLHTGDFPSGELRGQLKVVPIPGAAALMITALAALGGIGAIRPRSA